MKTSNKAALNSLIASKFISLDREDKHLLAVQLCKDFSTREIEALTGIPHSTITDWKTRRQEGKSSIASANLSNLYTKLLRLDPKVDKIDYGRIEMIKERCEELLKAREEGVR